MSERTDEHIVAWTTQETRTAAEHLATTLCVGSKTVYSLAVSYALGSVTFNRRLKDLYGKTTSVYSYPNDAPSAEKFAAGDKALVKQVDPDIFLEYSRKERDDKIIKAVFSPDVPDPNANNEGWKDD